MGATLQIMATREVVVLASILVSLAAPLQADECADYRQRIDTLITAEGGAIWDAAKAASTAATIAVAKIAYAQNETLSPTAMALRPAILAARNADEAATTAFHKLIRVPTYLKQEEDEAIDALRSAMASVHKAKIAFNELFYFAICE